MEGGTSVDINSSYVCTVIKEHLYGRIWSISSGIMEGASSAYYGRHGILRFLIRNELLRL